MQRSSFLLQLLNSFQHFGIRATLTIWDLRLPARGSPGIRVRRLIGFNVRGKTHQSFYLNAPVHRSAESEFSLYSQCQVSSRILSKSSANSLELGLASSDFSLFFFFLSESLIFTFGLVLGSAGPRNRVPRHEVLKNTIVIRIGDWSRNSCTLRDAESVTSKLLRLHRS